jgi:WXXGXW repeat (2 copies)
MKIPPIALFALLCGAAPTAAYAGVDIGITVGGPEVVVTNQPPPLRAEIINASPGPGFIWIRGHWRWRHERWEWIAGRWEMPAQPGMAWVPGRWAARGNGWVWIEGHYIVQAALPPVPPAAQVEVIASEEPPSPISEAVPAAPGPDYFWIGGHWHWNGGWVWMHGHFDRHPYFHPGGGWEPGRWEHRGGNWVWREGRWR